nr:MAG: protein m28 [Herpesviridae sp.]
MRTSGFFKSRRGWQVIIVNMSEEHLWGAVGESSFCGNGEEDNRHVFSWYESGAKRRESTGSSNEKIIIPSTVKDNELSAALGARCALEDVGDTGSIAVTVSTYENLSSLESSLIDGDEYTEVGGSVSGVEHVITFGLAYDPFERVRESIPTVRDLICASTLENENRFYDVENFVKRHQGLCLPLSEETELMLSVGNSSGFDAETLRSYPGVSAVNRLLVVGEIVCTQKWCPKIFVVYSSGSRTYAISESTRLLYIIAEGGFEELFTLRGYRYIYELYDVPENDELYIPLGMVPLARMEMADAVRRFVARRPGVSGGQKEGYRCSRNNGYFMIGNEKGLFLTEIVPARLFTYLRGAGYSVLGRGEDEKIVLFNNELEVFVLLDDCRVVKVANTLRGFLRDRLQYGFGFQRRCFTYSGNVDTCIGASFSFGCDLDYVIPGSNDLRCCLRTFQEYRSAKQYPEVTLYV